jgi:alginate O-acetyltransferase complex protein AlgI
MIFHSLAFVVFFVVTTSLYWALTHRAQNVLLLVASYTFYGWVHPWFLALIVSTTVIDYASALGMTRWPEHRKAFLWLSIVTNFGLLGFFKYFNFFVENVAAAAALVGWSIPLPVLSILLPVGISFYTFQSMSYTIDVYWGHLSARRSLLDMAVFVSFFPHLVAGPIMRASNLLPQVERDRRFSANAARDASLLIAWGFFKKLVVADNVGVIANKVFALKAPEFAMLWAGVFAFAIQIYADFSAYTDVARGTAKWLGFDLIRNFDHPYLATGPADFWRRWNISLTTWFRDYVFLPMSYALSRRIDGVRWLGLRDEFWIYAIATMATFLMSGLWHGASWSYVLWGGYHGALLVLARLAAPPRRKRRRARPWLVPAQVAGMFVLTCVGWLLFRETDLAALARDLSLSPFAGTLLGRQTGAYLFVLALVYSLPLWVQSAWAEGRVADLMPGLSDGGVRRNPALPPEPAVDDVSRPPLAIVASQACLCGLLFAVILVFRSRTSLDFIYFQF